MAYGRGWVGPGGGRDATTTDTDVDVKGGDGMTDGTNTGTGTGTGTDAGAAERAAARRMWHLLEPLHAVVYYAPEAYEEAAALGYGTAERWPAYFAWRAAPLGPAGAAETTAAFHSFSPDVVARHVPESWRIAAPAAVLAARTRAVTRTYAALLGPEAHAPGVAEAAALARRVAEAAVPAGPLSAANAALPWPVDPAAALWQAATVIREHRGDGHLAALRESGLDPVESLVSFAAIGAAPPEVFASRGWTPPRGRRPAPGWPPGAWSTRPAWPPRRGGSCAPRWSGEPMNWRRRLGGCCPRTSGSAWPRPWSRSGSRRSGRGCCPGSTPWGSGRCDGCARRQHPTFLIPVPLFPRVPP